MEAQAAQEDLAVEAQVAREDLAVEAQEDLAVEAQAAQGDLAVTMETGNRWTGDLALLATAPNHVVAEFR